MRSKNTSVSFAAVAAVSLLISVRKTKLVSASSWFDIGRTSTVSIVTLYIFSPLFMISGISNKSLYSSVWKKDHTSWSRSFLFQDCWRNFRVYTTKHSLGTISLPTCQSCTTLDVMIVNNFNINCLILMGIFRNTFSYNFPLITIGMFWCYHKK